MENIQSQLENIAKKYVSALVTEVSELQKSHIANALGMNGSNGAANGSSHQAVIAKPAATRVAAKRPVAKKVGKTVAAAKGTKRTKAEIDAAKGVKRDPEVLEKLSESILTYVSANCNKEDPKGNKGVNIETLSKALKTASKDLTLPMKKLMKDKKITTTGQKRATRYFAK
jgi:hypothetical protein